MRSFATKVAHDGQNVARHSTNYKVRKLDSSHGYVQCHVGLNQVNYIKLGAWVESLMHLKISLKGLF